MIKHSFNRNVITSVFIVIFTLSPSTQSLAVKRRINAPQHTRYGPYVVAAAAVGLVSSIAYSYFQHQPKKQQNDYSDSIDFENSLVVHQREYGIVSCKTEPKNVSILSTYHVNGCHFVILHDPEQGISIGIHWDDDTRKNEIEKILRLAHQRGMDANRIKAYFVGGWAVNEHYIYSKHFGDYLYKSLLAHGIKKENIHTSHMYERMTPDMPMDQFVREGKMWDKKYYFMGVSFDSCTGTLVLSDTLPPENVWKMPSLPGNGRCEYLMHIPGSGCPLRKAGG